MPNSLWTTSDGSSAVPTTYEVSEVASAFSPPVGGATVGKKGMVPSPNSVATANNYFLRADGTWAPITSSSAVSTPTVETKRPSTYSRSGDTQNFAESTDYQLAYDSDISHTSTFGNWDALARTILQTSISTLTFTSFANSSNLPYNTGTFTINICRGYETLRDGAGSVSSVQWDYSFDGTTWTNIATDYSNQPLSPTISTKIVSNTSPTLSSLSIRAVLTRGAGDSVPLPSQPDEPSQDVTYPGGQINLNIFDLWTEGVYQVANPGGGGVTSFNTRTGVVSLTSQDVTGALTFTPYNATNPSGYISSITSNMVTTALGFTPYNATNPSGYISSITSNMVTTALGYTPYNSSNPSGYISSITSNMVTTALGFTPYNASNPSGYISSITSAMISNAGGVVTSGSYSNPTWIASLSATKITGNITAYDLVGGSVSATTGTFSGIVTIKSGVPLGKMTLVPYGNANPSNPSEGDIAWIY